MSLLKITAEIGYMDYADELYGGSITLSHVRL